MTDLQEAELEIIYHSKRQKFPAELKVLQKGKSIKKTSHVYKLNPFLQNGILKVGGRLSHAAMPEANKYPSILPKYLKVTELIIEDIHKTIGHCGHNHVLSYLWQKYWVPNAHSFIRRILSKCVVCHRLLGTVG